MVRARVDQKTFMAFMIPFLLTIATAGLLLLVVYSSPDPDNSVLVDILLNLWMISLYAWLPIFIVLGIAFVYMGWYPPPFSKRRTPSSAAATGRSGPRRRGICPCWSSTPACPTQWRTPAWWAADVPRLIAGSATGLSCPRTSISPTGRAAWPRWSVWRPPVRPGTCAGASSSPGCSSCAAGSSGMSSTIGTADS